MFQFKLFGQGLLTDPCIYGNAPDVLGDARKSMRDTAT